jgi:magnesium transporter
MSRTLTRQSASLGLEGGALVHIGEKRVSTPALKLVEYDEKTIVERDVASLAEVADYAAQKSITWLNVDGVHEASVIEQIGACFKLHPLVLEDVMNTGQRSKVEDYGDVLFIVMKMLFWDDKERKIFVEQVSMVLGKGFVLTFQEKEEDVFQPVRERLRNGKGKLRKSGADFLAYALLDAIVDEYMVVLERFGDLVESVEGVIHGGPSDSTTHDIHVLKREALFLRRTIWPAREVIGFLEKTEVAFVAKNTKPYLRDVYDHVIQATEVIETFRDLLSSTLDAYLSQLSNRMNEVMKVLAIISTIFIPLTFIVGVYGMNFDHMPELRWPYGYPLVLGAMGVLSITLLVVFRRKRWL